MRRGGGVIGLAVLLAVAACVGPTEPSPVQPSATPGSAIGTPMVTPETSLPTASPAATPDCSSYDPADGFGKDPVLEAMFPASVAGGTLKGVTSYTMIATICLAARLSPSMVPQAMAGIPPGWDLASLSMARAEYDFPDSNSPIDVDATRSDGNDGSVMLNLALAGWNSEDFIDPYVEDIGGKSVRVVQDTFHDYTYLYASGEVLFQLSGTSNYADPDTTAVLRALP